jgi:hypothetical protein
MITGRNTGGNCLIHGIKKKENTHISRKTWMLLWLKKLVNMNNPTIIILALYSLIATFFAAP